MEAGEEGGNDAYADALALPALRPLATSYAPRLPGRISIPWRAHGVYGLTTAYTRRLVRPWL